MSTISLSKSLGGAGAATASDLGLMVVEKVLAALQGRRLVTGVINLGARLENARAVALEEVRRRLRLRVDMSLVIRCIHTRTKRTNSATMITITKRALSMQVMSKVALNGCTELWHLHRVIYRAMPRLSCDNSWHVGGVDLGKAV